MDLEKKEGTGGKGKDRRRRKGQEEKERTGGEGKDRRGGKGQEKRERTGGEGKEKEGTEGEGRCRKKTTKEEGISIMKGRGGGRDK